MLLHSRKNSVQVDHLVEVNDLVKFFRNERRATNESAINICHTVSQALAGVSPSLYQHRQSYQHR